MNDLQVILNESGLHKSQIKVLMESFDGYFEFAADWEKKASAIRVTNASQVDDMKIARIGRLALREKRIHIESTRKELKERSLREGRAIDGIANILKAAIIPIEEYLDQQERFVEIQEEKKREAVRIEVERKMEADRIKQEKEKAREDARIRAENEKLKKERDARENDLARERARAEAEKRRHEETLRKQKEKSERAKKEAEARQKKLEDDLRKKQEDEDARMIVCPECGHKFKQKGEKQ